MHAHTEGYEAGVLFVVQREDAQFFTPNIATDPLFSGLLKKGYEEGLVVRALRCVIRGNTITIDSEIPVRFDTAGRI